MQINKNLTFDKVTGISFSSDQIISCCIDTVFQYIVRNIHSRREITPARVRGLNRRSTNDGIFDVIDGISEIRPTENGVACH